MYQHRSIAGQSYLWCNFCRPREATFSPIDPAFDRRERLYVLYISRIVIKSAKYHLRPGPRPPAAIGDAVAARLQNRHGMKSIDKDGDPIITRIASKFGGRGAVMHPVALVKFRTDWGREQQDVRHGGRTTGYF